ncbi:MAG: hypothetical protein ACRDRI_16690 [Pseudonocardiaceae bacterium]
MLVDASVLINIIQRHDSSPVRGMPAASVVRQNLRMDEQIPQTSESEATLATSDPEVHQIEINDLPDFPLLMQTEY